MAYQAPDYGGYQRARNSAYDNYNKSTAANAYGRFVSQQRGQRNLGDMSRGFQRQFPSKTASFGQRGLSGGGVNSGSMQQSMNRYIGDYGRQYGRAQQDMTQQRQQYDMTQMQSNSQLQQQLGAIEAQKANDISAAAANLDWLRNLVGSL